MALSLDPITDSEGSSFSHTTLVAASAAFEGHWPFVVDETGRCAAEWGPTYVVRTPRGSETPLGELLAGDSGVQAGNHADTITRLICLDIPVEDGCLACFPKLQEAVFLPAYGGCYLPEALQQSLAARGVKVYQHTSEGFWGQSVAEFALGLTLAALRRIPQNYHALRVGAAEAWEQYAPERNLGPGKPGAQYSDDNRFTNGTIAGKRVRVIGAGNIGSRYAHFCSMLGADVAIWDPFAPEPNFHRTGARRVWHLPSLVTDAEIFAPMLPLHDGTRGIVSDALIRSLPAGCLVVLATRAGIVDIPTLRRRVLDDELALAADVFDIEPLPLDDPLLGRDNVVHTPHLAGRTRDANVQWVHDLLRQFVP